MTTKLESLEASVKNVLGERLVQSVVVLTAVLLVVRAVLAPQLPVAVSVQQVVVLVEPAVAYFVLVQQVLAVRC